MFLPFLILIGLGVGAVILSQKVTRQPGAAPASGSVAAAIPVPGAPPAPPPVIPIPSAPFQPGVLYELVLRSSIPIPPVAAATSSGDPLLDQALSLATDTNRGQAVGTAGAQVAAALLGSGWIAGVNVPTADVLTGLGPDPTIWRTQALWSGQGTGNPAFPVVLISAVPFGAAGTVTTSGSAISRAAARRRAMRGRA